MVGIKRGFTLRKETSTARTGKNWNSLQGVKSGERRKTQLMQNPSCKAGLFHWDLGVGHELLLTLQLLLLSPFH